jgi:hypothetical protein
MNTEGLRRMAGVKMTALVEALESVANDVPFRARIAEMFSRN